MMLVEANNILGRIAALDEGVTAGIARAINMIDEQAAVTLWAEVLRVNSAARVEMVSANDGPAFPIATPTDPYCDGIACIAELDPDARDDREAVEEVQDLIRLGRAWQIMERHGLPAAVRALGHAGYATPLRSAAGGAELIAAERQRQVTAEGWTPEHDDEHGQGELAGAAVCYVVHALHQDDPYIDDDEPWPLPQWPWGRAWWKPSGDPIRNLVKAGALIAAEIDRLQRREEPGHGD